MCIGRVVGVDEFTRAHACKHRRRRPAWGVAQFICLGVVATLQVVASSEVSTPPSQPARASGLMVQVWVELNLPVLGASGAGSGIDAAAKSAQADLVRRMRALGAIELGRVRVLRQAIAVEVPANRIDDLRALEGVRRITPVRDVDRPPPTTPR